MDKQTFPERSSVRDANEFLGAHCHSIAPLRQSDDFRPSAVPVSLEGLLTPRRQPLQCDVEETPMTPIRIRRKIDSETLHLPELKPLVGRTVEITISENLEPAAAREFSVAAGHVPSSEAQWAAQQATFRSWRADSRFEPFWPIIDR